jgi:hypothetical protein
MAVGGPVAVGGSVGAGNTAGVSTGVEVDVGSAMDVLGNAGVVIDVSVDAKVRGIDVVGEASVAEEHPTRITVINKMPNLRIRSSPGHCATKVFAVLLNPLAIEAPSRSLFALIRSIICGSSSMQRIFFHALISLVSLVAETVPGRGP